MTTGESLHQTEEEEGLDAAREDAGHRGGYEEHHRTQQRRLAAVLVAQGAEEELTNGQPHHAHREAQLHERGRSLEPAGQRRKRRKIEVRQKGAEGRYHPDDHQQVGLGVAHGGSGKCGCGSVLFHRFAL
jgi:hypothetical protein